MFFIGRRHCKVLAFFLLNFKDVEHQILQNITVGIVRFWKNRTAVLNDVVERHFIDKALKNKILRIIF